MTQENLITQELVREKLLKRLKREKQCYIAERTGIPSPVLSTFKQDKKILWDSSLIVLNDYLDGKLEI